MKPLFLADADLHPPEGTRDLHVLAFAAEHNRVLVSHDVNTMPRHFQEFTNARTSPGLILIPQRLAIGTAIEELLLVWECNDARDFLNTILYLPL